MTEPMPEDPIITLLRGVLAQNNNCSPSAALYGAAGATSTSEQREHARRLAEHAAKAGYLESLDAGWGGAFLRVRVTDAGLDYLAEH